MDREPEKNAGIEIDSLFVLHFNSKQNEAYRVNVANGWWQGRTEVFSLCASEGINYGPNLIIELIGLAHTELSEAVEAARKHPVDRWDEYKTKDTLVRELAGTVVRIMDMAAYFDLPLGKAIEAEIDANRTRGYKHGGKAA